MPRFTYNKKNKKSKYICVYEFGKEWVVRSSIEGCLYKYGPFETEIEAAREYDNHAIKYGLNGPFNFHKKPNINIENNDNVKKNDIIKSANITKTITKINDNIAQKPLKRKRCVSLKNKSQKDKDYDGLTKRIVFPVWLRNRVAFRQLWKCNICKNLLNETFIVDHILPLFLKGTNSDLNLQALCPSCDRFKTSYLDWRVIKPLSLTKTITVKEILFLQNKNYVQLSAMDHSNMDDIYDDNINISTNSVDDKSITSMPVLPDGYNIPPISSLHLLDEDCKQTLQDDDCKQTLQDDGPIILDTHKTNRSIPNNAININSANEISGNKNIDPCIMNINNTLNSNKITISIGTMEITISTIK